MLSDLEVCVLEENTYIDLPTVLTRRHLPVKEGNIPRQKDIEKWPYLHEVRLPHIEAAVGLLIGVNAHKAMEPWKVINSISNGALCSEDSSWLDSQMDQRKRASRQENLVYRAIQ